MFTGIIETLGLVENIEDHGSGKTFWVSSPISSELSPDQSVSHDGVCLTVEETKNHMYRVTAIHETLLKSCIGDWQKGQLINIERCMMINGRLDGHIVQGHVDTPAICTGITEKNGSSEFRFSFPSEFASLIIEKGSICLNGISLTLFDVSDSAFSVAIIPYTYENTNMRTLKPGSRVNIEFDVIGKYVQRLLRAKT